MEEVDREFMKPNKFFIKHILKGDHKRKVFPDSQIYTDASVNDRLKEKSYDYFME